MSKKPGVVASYGDPKKPKRWPAKRIRREFAEEILEADVRLPFKCLVSGCLNHSDAGTMIDPLCLPCDRMLRDGTSRGHGLTWVAALERKLKRVQEVLDT